MICVKKLKNIVPIALACVVIIAFFSFGAVISYLTDAETKTNIITIGNVKLEVSEPNYQDSSVVAAGDSIIKDPIIKNTGTKDEYVFFRVAVPKRKVTLLYEKDTKVGEGDDAPTYKEGTPTVKNRTIDSFTGETTEIKTNSDEIYKIIAEGDIKAYVKDELGDNPPVPNAEPQLDISYNKGDSDSVTEDEDKRTKGWIYLSRELDQKISDEENAPEYDYYYFGYNKRLLNSTNPEVPSVTIPLFDRIQLKSFIDEEINGTPTTKKNEETEIVLTAYGVQADSLGIEDVDALGRDDFLTKDQLLKVLKIVNGKKG